VIEFQALFDDGNQYVDEDGDPDLRFHRVLGGPVKGLDAQVLFDPFEEQFDLPATSVKLCDRNRRQCEVVGQKNQASVFLGVEEANASQFFGVILSGVETVKKDGLVALQPGGFVDRMRVKTFEIQISFGPRHKKGRGLMDHEQAGKVEIAAIHHVDRPWLERDIVEDVDIVNLAVGNNNKDGNGTPQVQKRVKFHGPLALAELGPGKER